MTKGYFVAGILICSLIVVFAMQTVSKPALSNTYHEAHFVEKVFSPCCQDIVVKLRGDNHINYINRGLEMDLLPKELHELLQARIVDITFINHRSIFGPNHRTIAKIQLGEKIIYNALT